MFRHLAITITAAFLALAASAQTAEEFFELGRRAYNAGEYEKAASDFDESAAKGGGADAYHNAANAYFKLGKTGLAMLNYERARYISPRSPETAANIRMLEEQIGGPRRARSFADTFFGELSNSEWTALGCAAFWGAVFTLAIPPLFSVRKSGFRISGGLCVAILLTSCAGALYWADARNTAVSISADAVLKLSPASSAPAVAAMPEGRRAIIRKRENGHMFLETPDKKYGWATSEKMKPLWE